MDVINIASNASVVTPTSDAKQQEVFMNTFLTCGNIICVLFGIPLNLVIIVFIAIRRRLRRQPRNIIWVGISLSNIFVLLFGFYSTEATELCRFRFFLLGFPYASVLMNHFLSLVDRYLSIFHSVWYRRCVTVRLVLGIQLTTFILLLLLMKPHYIFGFIQVKCNEVHPLDRAIFFGFIVSLAILCLATQLTLYFMIKKHLVLPISNINQDQNTNGGNDTTNATEADESTRNIRQQNFPAPTDTYEEIYIAPEEATRALSLPVESRTIIKQNLHFVRIRDQMVSRLELEATRNVILIVGIILLFSSPWIVSSVLSLICNANVINQAKSEELTAKALVEQCSPYYWAISYTRLIILIGHTVYQIVGFILRGKYLCAGLGRVHRRRRKNGCPRVIREPAQKFGKPIRMRTIHKNRHTRQPRGRVRFQFSQRVDSVE